MTAANQFSNIHISGTPFRLEGLVFRFNSALPILKNQTEVGHPVKKKTSIKWISIYIYIYFFRGNI